MVIIVTFDIENKVIEAKNASIRLASVNTYAKNMALEAMAEALDKNRQEILNANAKDLEYAKKLQQDNKLS